MENKKTTFDEINKEGKEYYEKREYDEALKIFQEALKLLPKKRACPKRRKALFNIGTTFLRLGDEASKLDDKKCKKFFKKALETFEEALDNPKEEIENKVYDYHIHHNMGIIYNKMKSYSKAIKSYNNAEKDTKCDDKKFLDTSSSEVLGKINSAKGITYFNMGEYNKSRIFFEEALQYDKNDLFTRICLAELYLSINNLDLANEQIEEFINDEKNEKIIDNMKYYAFIKEIEGRKKIEDKKYDEASTCFIKATKYDLDRCRLLLLDIYSHYLSAIFSWPQDRISKENLHFIIEKFENVCDYCERKKDYNTKKIALYYLGYFYARGQDYITAIDRLKQCIQIKYIDQSRSENIQSFFKSIFSEVKSFFCGQSRTPIQEQARELLKNIYQRAYKPSL
jgi:tetratricopeptide (TPR) repeat protein